MKLPAYKAGHLKRQGRHSSPLTKRGILIEFHKRKNPYAKRLKQQVTIRMGIDIIDYFKQLADETGIPYQNLINLYLRDCVQSHRKLSMKWAS